MAVKQAAAISFYCHRSPMWNPQTYIYTQEAFPDTHRFLLFPIKLGLGRLILICAFQENHTRADWRVGAGRKQKHFFQGMGSKNACTRLLGTCVPSQHGVKKISEVLSRLLNITSGRHTLRRESPRYPIPERAGPQERGALHMLRNRVSKKERFAGQGLKKA